MATSTLGIAAGIAGALAVTRAIRGLLYGIEPTDVTTFIAVTAALLLACLTAAYLPARRATRIDPVEALRRD